MEPDLFSNGLENVLIEASNCDIRIMEDSISFHKKPDKNDISRIVKRLRDTVDTVDGIARKAAYGRTFRPGILFGGTSTEYWICQQCFFVDVEHSYTVSQGIAICKRAGMVPNIIYSTFHYRPSDQRYCIVFVTPEPIFDVKLRDAIQDALFHLFHSDPQTNSRERMFLGGRLVFWEDKTARLDVQKLLRVEVNPYGV